jgi:ABC-2 type transport system permease protein
MDAMRQVLFHTPGIFDVWGEAGFLAVLSVVFFVLARKLLRGIEQKARREGRLTVRWQ